MAKKIQKSNSEISQDFKTKSPETTLRSAGSFYIHKREKANGSTSWRVLFESWRDGKKKTEEVHKNLYSKIGLTPEMSLEEARKATKDYNKSRKRELAKNSLSHQEIKARRRFEEMKDYNKTLFPPELVEEFTERLRSSSEGEDRFKNRLLRCFEIVQEMTTKLNLLPHDYEPDFDRLTNYFKEKKYSTSYSKDILWVLNKWGGFYSRKNTTFFEPVGKIRNQTLNAISKAQKSKDGVRRESKPMTEELVKKLGEKIRNKDDLKELKRFNFVFACFYLGLRPKECDDVLKESRIEKRDGISVLVVLQTKLVFVEDEKDKEKRIPILCDEQEKAIEYIKNGQAQRPPQKWLDENLEDLKKPSEHYDLYSGRKGFLDFMLSEKMEQKIENISLYLGHKSIATTWKHYKDHSRVDFTPTEFTQKKKTG